MPYPVLRRTQLPSLGQYRNLNNAIIQSCAIHVHYCLSYLGIRPVLIPSGLPFSI